MPLNESGEIIAKGPTIMRGNTGIILLRRRKDHERRVAADRRHRLHGRRRVHLHRRPQRDMVRRGGFNVYPREIDELMYSHPKVLNACSFGVPDPEARKSLKLARWC